ncbi:MAG: TIR domain-containing protein [Methylococcaceae bacterium]
MTPEERKKITVIHKYAVESFTEGDWYTLGQLTGKLSDIQEHPRLFRSMSFGDDDYDFSVAEVINSICEENSEYIDLIIDHFDMDLWYEQKDPKKYKKIFESSIRVSPDFWEKGYLKVFISHLAKSKKQIGLLKDHLEYWGVSSFVAHEDIEPSREWMVEIEKALASMDVLVAVVEPEFPKSQWTDQEVGYALGRNVDVIPVRAGHDPYGFMGKYQGIQAKGKYPSKVAQDIVKSLLKKPKHRDRLISSIGKAIRLQNSDSKIERIKTLVTWSLLTNEQVVNLLENSSLSDYEKSNLKEIIDRVGAFLKAASEEEFDFDIPF